MIRIMHIEERIMHGGRVDVDMIMVFMITRNSLMALDVFIFCGIPFWLLDIVFE